MAGRRSFKTDESFCCPKLRPSGHHISRRFAGGNGGSINLKSAISDQAQRGASAFRCVDELPAEELATHSNRLHSDDVPVEVNRQQRKLVLRESLASYATRRRRG